MITSNLAVLYLRVSTEEQARENYSLESQERFCRQFCKQRGWEVAAVFKDEGISAFKDVERPGFQQMIAYVQSRKGINLVFYDYSRFGRHTERALRDFRVLDKCCFSIAATNPGIDCRTPAGRTARRDELSRAEDFSDRNSANTAVRMEAARQEGRCPREAPVGYRNVKAERGQSNIIPSDSAPLVVKAFELMATGNYKAAEVLKTMTAQGLRSIRDNPMTLHCFLKMLRNETYIGKLPSRKYRNSVK